MLTTPPLHLAIALDAGGWRRPARPQGGGAEGWDRPEGEAPVPYLTAGSWIELVTEADRALLDLVTLQDDYRPVPGAETSAGGRLDAVMIACRVAPATRQIGIVPAVPTTLTEPFLVSTQIATLDFVTCGRAGWQPVVSTRPDDSGYVGPRTVPPPEERFDEAIDHVDVVRRLWDSWEDDAEIRDGGAHRFIDRDRIHHIDFAGRYFSVKGPSITPRPPQGQPIVAVAADGAAATAFAGRAADVVFVPAGEAAELARRVTEVTEAAAGAGREPADLRLFADVTVALDDDPGRARERAAALDADGLVFAGTTAALAEQLAAWSEDGITGFRLLPAALPDDLRTVTRQLVPYLGGRGRLSQPDPGSTLRGRLGLGRPANRYASVA